MRHIALFLIILSTFSLIIVSAAADFPPLLGDLEDVPHIEDPAIITEEDLSHLTDMITLEEPLIDPTEEQFFPDLHRIFGGDPCETLIDRSLCADFAKLDACLQKEAEKTCVDGVVMRVLCDDEPDSSAPGGGSCKKITDNGLFNYAQCSIDDKGTLDPIGYPIGFYRCEKMPSVPDGNDPLEQPIAIDEVTDSDIVLTQRPSAVFLPDVASQIAADELGDLDFTIQLKGPSYESTVYELTAEKQGSLFWFIPVTRPVSITIDASTGEIIEVTKPSLFMRFLGFNY